MIREASKNPQLIPLFPAAPRPLFAKITCQCTVAAENAYLMRYCIIADFKRRGIDFNKSLPGLSSRKKCR